MSPSSPVNDHGRRLAELEQWRASSDARFRGLEDQVRSVAETQRTMSDTQRSNHTDNRNSIHDLKDGQQTIIDQNALHQQDVTRLQTKMDIVIGSDHGKPGKLDQMSEQIQRIPDIFESKLSTITDKLELKVRDTLEKVDENTKNRYQQNWIYEIGKLVVMGGIAAAAAHWARG